MSGGGYIGSWLSAWIARAGYDAVWRKLIGRRDHPDEEPGETSWLRAYSNYLTPRLGLFSADTWTAVALYIRNLVLNWLVILPALVPCCCSPSRSSACGLLRAGCRHLSGSWLPWSASSLGVLALMI